MLFVDANSRKLKIDVFFWGGGGWGGGGTWSKMSVECGQSCHWTLKLTESQESTDGMKQCKFRKAKSCFNDFWVGVVKSGCDHLLHETLTSTLP